MKNKIEIIIDLTAGEEEIWKQIEEATEALNKLGQKNPSLWKRIKSWF